MKRRVVITVERRRLPGAVKALEHRDDALRARIHQRRVGAL